MDEETGVTSSGSDQPAGLNGFDLSQRIYVATGGHVGIVSKLLVAAILTATERKCVLDRKLLGEVWANLRRKQVEQQEIDFDRDVEVTPVVPAKPVPPAENPFLCKPDKVKQIWVAQRKAAAKAAAAAEAERKRRRAKRRPSVLEA